MRLLLLPAALLSLALPSVAEAAKRPMLYVYKGAGCDGRRMVPYFERFVGRRVDGVIDFVSTESWAEFQSSGRWIVNCWKGSRYRLSLAVPMLPKNTKGVSLKKGAAGEYDHYFRRLAKDIVRAGYGRADLRIGWEFNGGWYPWAAAKDPAAFRAYFRRIVRVMRSVPGERFRINFNPNLGTEKISPESVYPGDRYVDVIAVDVYNNQWSEWDRLAEPRWQAKLWKGHGLRWVASFAKKHRKEIAVPEWGTGTRPDGHGAGDDPLFISRMADWMIANKVRYHGYWDYPARDYHARISRRERPKSSDMFIKRFGPQPRE